MMSQEYTEQQFVDRKVFMKLPVEVRWQIMEEQAKPLQKHYDELVEKDEPGGGNFFCY